MTKHPSCHLGFSLIHFPQTTEDNVITTLTRSFSGNFDFQAAGVIVSCLVFANRLKDSTILHVARMDLAVSLASIL